ncbi:MAG: sugar phosphate isomerase/epimerase [Armatimonadaceae bacterium]
MANLPINLQLYTVRDDLNNDFVGTIKTVAEIGYSGVEIAGYAGKTASEVKQILDDHGLKVVGGHVGIDQVTKNTETVIEEYTAFGSPYVVVPYIGEEWRKSADDYKRLGETLAEAGAKYKAAGLTLCYHNHAFEFEKFDGQYGFDILFDSAPADVLQMEMDTFWVKKGGEDIPAYLKKYSGRVPLVHLKDMSEDGDFRPVGEGTVDYTALFEAAEASGSRFYIVEQDKCTTATPLESIRISFENLKKMGKV